jgi:hypothetical protein
MVMGKKEKRPTYYEPPLKIKGNFLEMFKIVKKDKEVKTKKKP